MGDGPPIASEWTKIRTEPMGANGRKTRKMVNFNDYFSGIGLDEMGPCYNIMDCQRQGGWLLSEGEESGAADVKKTYDVNRECPAL
jgi:hypothetical protein